MKSPVKSITVARVEGPKSECGVKTLDGQDAFEQVQRVLFGWGMSAPRVGEGYDKVDFLISWENGQVYEGRFDMVQGGRNSSNQSLRDQVGRSLRSFSGRMKPPHWTPQQYATVLSRDMDGVKTCGEILDTCEV